MRILWITSRLLPEACRVLGFKEEVVGGWMQSQLDALLDEFGDRNEYFVLAADVRKCDIKVGRVHHRSFGKGMVTYGETVPLDVELAAREAIAEFNPDIIHIYGTEFFYGRMRKAVFCGKPVVVSLQGILQGCHPQVGGILAHKEVLKDQLNLRRLIYGQTIFKSQDDWRTMRVPQEELVFKSHSNFMGRTEWDRAWTKALNPAATYYHVNETLRKEFYGGLYRNRNAIHPHSIYCSAAAGYPLKGVHYLLRAIAFLKGKYPDIQLRVCAADRLTNDLSFMAKLKIDQYTSYLRRLIRELHIENHVVGLSRLTAKEVASELSKAELFVLPSLCENSPNSLGEAQLIGTPSIATFVGGISSVLRDGIDGRLVPAADPASLADMIDWFFLHPAEADAYAASARVVAIKRHDACLNAYATMKAYEEIVAE